MDKKKMSHTSPTTMQVIQVMPRMSNGVSVPKWA